MNNKKILAGGILILLAVSLILYYKPLTSDKPLGLDATGHLSKISYMKEFGFVSWDRSWYSGAPFLKFYSPLFYWIVYLFNNIIFGANLLCFLSIFLTSVGIFLLVKHHTRNFYASLFAGLFFLSVINFSYYYIAVGNHPFVFSMLFFPFTLLFLEKSFSSRFYFVLYNLFFVLAFISHVFIGLCLFAFIFLRLSFVREKRNFFWYLVLPLLLSSFWLIPFLSKSSGYVGDELYVPTIKQILGIDAKTFWGKGVGSVGISVLVFLVLACFAGKKIFRDKIKTYFLACTVISFLLLMGILGKYYPTGVGAIRFVSIFSIFMCISIGLFLNEINFRNSMKVLLIISLIFALYFNHLVIEDNFYRFSHNSQEDFYGLITGSYQDQSFPVSNEFSNYRFGSARYQFSETLTYIFPQISQTSGYYDQGILYPSSFSYAKEAIWASDDLNQTLYYLDWFGIKYFEMSGGYLGNIGKLNNSEFSLVMEKSGEYPFRIYEYKNPSQIISVLKGNIISYLSIDEKEIGEMAKLNQNTQRVIPIISTKNISITNEYSLVNSSVIRNNPDLVEVSFEKSDGKSTVLFKESYYNSWRAIEYPSGQHLEIFKTANNFMLVIPNTGSEKVVFYQSRTTLDWIGIIVSLIGIILLLFFLMGWNKS